MMSMLMSPAFAGVVLFLAAIGLIVFLLLIVGIVCGARALARDFEQEDHRWPRSISRERFP